MGESTLVGEVDHCGGDDDGEERTWEAFHPSSTSHDDGDAHHTHNDGIPLQGGDVAEIARPLVDKSCWHSAFDGES